MDKDGVSVVFNGLGVFSFEDGKKALQFVRHVMYNKKGAMAGMVALEMGHKSHPADSPQLDINYISGKLQNFLSTEHPGFDDYLKETDVQNDSRSR